MQYWFFGYIMIAYQVMSLIGSICIIITIVRFFVENNVFTGALLDLSFWYELQEATRGPLYQSLSRVKERSFNLPLLIKLHGLISSMQLSFGISLVRNGFIQKYLDIEK